jgi:hypothetical protein
MFVFSSCSTSTYLAATCFRTSCMFELYVVVAGIIMFNILKLIMKIVPNYLTSLSA